jgi:CYTH domain-containing protein
MEGRESRASDLPREIERKYLLSALPTEARKHTPFEIDQGYVPGREIHERLRRTKRDGEELFYRTIKLGKGRSRIEVEEEVLGEFFFKMWPLTEGRRVQKRRYAIPDGNHVWEIDEFLDRELALAEIELSSEDAAFSIPSWLTPYIVREVTDEPAYLNLSLAR